MPKKKSGKASNAKGAKRRVTKKKKSKKVSPKGIAYIKATYNNTIITVTDMSGDTIVSSSPGMIGYSGSKKSTSYAATKAGEDAAQKAVNAGMKEVEIYVKGLGIGRNSAVKGIRSGGLKITMIMDKTPIPHGGPTPRKMPRGS
jgi:small subunit ribosomal protein S11